MCLRIFVPTYRRLALFLFFALLPLTGILSLLPPLQVFLTLPFVFIHRSSAAIIAQIAYSYVLACIYAAAYLWLERSLRKQFPHANDIIERRRKKRFPKRSKKSGRRVKKHRK